MSKCRLCDDPIGGYYCNYCGFRNYEILGKEAELADIQKQKETREMLLKTISEVGIITWRYNGITNDKPDFKKEYFPLISSPQLQNDKIVGTSKSITVYKGEKVFFYKTANRKTNELPSEKLNCKGEAFEFRGVININLKLDVYCNSEKVIENLKLGTTLITS